MTVHADPTQMEETAINITDNLLHIRERMKSAGERVGREANEITLVAVSKTKPFDMVLDALAAGQLDFGENRFEDAMTKVEESAQRGLSQIRWHFIGTIQSRKTAQTVGPFTLVHSVDRIKIAKRLNQDAAAKNCSVSVLLQANVSGEESKHGFAPDELLKTLPEIAELSHLQIQGLMTMAPFYSDPEQTRPVFQALRSLRDRLHKAYPMISWNHLSMGMTNDFEVAIEEGATIVRIGSAIFGERHYANHIPSSAIK